MKIIISNTGKKKIKLSRVEWENIGLSNGWTKKAQQIANPQSSFTYLLPATLDAKKSSLIFHDLNSLEEKFNNIYNRFIFKQFPISQSQLDILKDPTTKSSIEFLISIINGNNYFNDNAKKELISGLNYLTNFTDLIIKGNGNASPAIISSVASKRDFVNNVLNVTRRELTAISNK